jgi:hypothetical protein
LPKAARCEGRGGVPADAVWQWFENKNDKNINIEIFLNIAYLDPA